MGIPVPDSGTVTEDSGATLTVSGDIDYLLGSDAGEWTAEVIVGSYDSQLEIDVDGNWTYTADNANATINALDTGDTLQEVFTVTSNNGTSTITITIEGNTDVPCFTEGTLISTPMGPRPVEALSVGDLVITRDHGLQAIRWIGKRQLSGTRLQAYQNMRPVLIKRGALGPDRPARDVRVSPLHRVLVEGQRNLLYFGQDQVLVPSKFLINGQSILIDVTATQVTYYHFLFDQHELVQSDGLISESFHPGHIGLSAFEEAMREEVLTLFPELRDTPQTYGPSARYSLKAFEGALMRDMLFQQKRGQK